MADQTFPVGTPILISATVTANGVAVSDTLSYSASSGTIVPDSADLGASLTGAAAGPVTVTATDPDGNVGTVSFTVTEPIVITLTASAATDDTNAAPAETTAGA